MSETRVASRTVFILNRGGRVCLLIAVLMLLFGAYVFFKPLDIPSPDGPMFNCGSAVHPPREQFAKNVCGRIATDHQMQAGFLAGGAVIVALGGLVAFGASRRTEQVRDEVDAGPGHGGPGHGHGDDPDRARRGDQTLRR
jgi:hypothetical protein